MNFKYYQKIRTEIDKLVKEGSNARQIDNYFNKIIENIHKKFQQR